MNEFKFIGFTFLTESEAPEYKARMTLAQPDGNWDILVSRLHDGTLCAEITTPDGHEYFPASGGYSDMYLRDVRREAINLYTFERNKAHCV